MRIRIKILNVNSGGRKDRVGESLKTDISVSSMASKKCLAQNKEYWGKMTDKLP